MGNLRPFQIAMLGIFGVMAVMAVVLISNYRPADTTETAAFGDRVIIWGSLEQAAFDQTFKALRDQDDSFKAVEYYEIDEAGFNNQLVNAIAEGRSPDLIVLPHDQLVQLRSKLLPVPYETISERQYRDTYVDGAEIFARTDGVYAIPFAVDPLMMYWNRDLFASNGLAAAPTSWEEVVRSVVPALTRKDTNRTILRSAIAFGEYRNVRNAGAVLSTLLLQSGSRMIEEGERGYIVALNESIGDSGRPPLEAALQFYADFSNANSPAYSWNRAQAEDRSAFVSGDLALYFGMGSEALTISDRNPNLNFDIAPVPQGANATIERTYGRFYGFAIPRAAQNRSGAFAAAQTLAAPGTAQVLSESLLLAPVTRTIIAQGNDGAFQQVIYRSALTARGWLDPNPVSTAGILQTMVEDVVSNRVRLGSAVADAVDRVTLSF